METITLNVQGMTCGGCVASVTRVLKAVPGVDDVDGDAAAGRANVTLDPAQHRCAGAASGDRGCRL